MGVQDINVELDNNVNQLIGQLEQKEPMTHAPRILMLTGSIRQGSHTQKLVNEAKHILQAMGAEVRIFDPTGLPIFDGEQSENEKVKQLREWAIWSEGMVWCSPEIHGNFSGVFKNQIDWIPLSSGAVRPTQGKTLALMQITGGSQSFNVVNNMRILGRWMRMFTIANQSSIAKAYKEFDTEGKLKPSSYRDRVIDVLQELVRMTLILREQQSWLTERYSENKTSYASNEHVLNQVMQAAGIN